MGNCLNVLSYDQPQEKARVITYDGELLSFKGSTKAKKVTSGPHSGFNLVHHSRPFSPLSPKAKLELGEVYYLVPDFGGSPKQTIKIVVTRKELNLLLGSSSKQFQISRDIVGLCESLGFEEGSSPKWRPSLSSIAEVKDF